MTSTSADPDDLATYVDAAGDGTARITTSAAELRGALGSFRASEGRAAFIADVPEVDLDLSFLAQRWGRLAGWLDHVAQAFAAADGGDGGRLTVDDRVLDRRAGRFRAPEVEVIGRAGRLVLDTGGGDDVVFLDEQDGVVTVLVNGVVHRFEVGEAEVVLRVGAGHDTVWASLAGRSGGPGRTLDGGSGADLLAVRGPGAALVRGGSGDDGLRGGAGDDRLLGGPGADRLIGGAGDDRLLGGDGGDVIDGDQGDDWVTSGEGDDLVYGGAGADLIRGGGGRDHLDAGAGGDDVGGGAGADILSGGEGHDTVDGGGGDDVAYTGPGHDLLIGGPGSDDLHVEGDDVVVDGSSDDVVLAHDVRLALLDAIVVDPPEGAFADRVRSDLVTLASTEAGARLLASLRCHTITVVPDLGGDDVDSDAFDPDGDVVQYWLGDDQPGFGAFPVDSPRRSPSYSPLVGLHHELVHASHEVNGGRLDGVYRGPDREQLDTNRDGRISYDDDHEPDEDGDGTPDHDHSVRNEERATVGLPVDHDEDPSTPDVPADDLLPVAGSTENELRDELGLPERGRY